MDANTVGGEEKITTDIANHQLPELEQLCPQCKGRGRWNDGSGLDRCNLCGGAGYKPTEFGKKVIALMRHNFKPMLRDATDD
jgi:DnaJ-class molecular chaperone